jgi:hypothetical protein
MTSQVNGMRARALQAYRLLNDLLLDLLVGHRSLEFYDSAAFQKALPRVMLTGMKRMAISHTIMTLAKWVEFYEKYSQVIPADVRAQCKTLAAEIREKRIRDFRNKVVGHIWDNESQRPLVREEIDSHLDRIFPHGRKAFMLWVNDPSKQEYPQTVVSIVERVRDHIAAEYAISDAEVFKRGHRGKWEGGVL